jgi:hypothetical protein
MVLASHRLGLLKLVADRVRSAIARTFSLGSVILSGPRHRDKDSSVILYSGSLAPDLPAGHDAPQNLSERFDL